MARMLHATFATHVLVLDFLVFNERVLVVILGGLLLLVLSRALLLAEAPDAPANQAQDQKSDHEEAGDHSPGEGKVEP